MLLTHTHCTISCVHDSNIMLTLMMIIRLWNIAPYENNRCWNSSCDHSNRVINASCTNTNKRSQSETFFCVSDEGNNVIFAHLYCADEFLSILPTCHNSLVSLVLSLPNVISTFMSIQHNQTQRPLCTDNPPAKHCT